MQQLLRLHTSASPIRLSHAVVLILPLPPSLSLPQTTTSTTLPPIPAPSLRRRCSRRRNTPPLPPASLANTHSIALLALLALEAPHCSCLVQGAPSFHLQQAASPRLPLACPPANNTPSEADTPSVVHSLPLLYTHTPVVYSHNTHTSTHYSTKTYLDRTLTLAHNYPQPQAKLPSVPQSESHHASISRSALPSSIPHTSSTLHEPAASTP